MNPHKGRVVLGLISSKFPELEDKAAIKARIKEATQYVPLEQLCLSPTMWFCVNRRREYHDGSTAMDKSLLR